MQPPKYRARVLLAQFYVEGARYNLNAAEIQAKAAMRLDPGRVDAYAILAAVQADRADWSDLDSMLELALREVPDDALPYYRAAERLLAAGRDAVKAERYLRVYLAQEPEGNRPNASEARWKLGWALEAQGRTAAALSEFRESVRLDPESKATQDLKRLRYSRPVAGSNLVGHQ